MEKYGIKKIIGVKIIAPKMELVKKNRPNSKKVTKEVYYDFIKNNSRYIYESYNNASADTYVVKDKYGNIIASIYYYMEENYRINPELLKLSKQTKQYIEDEFKKVGEEIIDLGNCKICNIDSSVKFE